MANSKRPVIMVVERVTSERQYPAGYAEVTRLRTMTWLEHVWYRIRERIRGNSGRTPVSTADHLEVNVAVQLSEYQYLELVRGKRHTVQAMKYLQGNNPTFGLELVPPACYATLPFDDEELVV